MLVRIFNQDYQEISNSHNEAIEAWQSIDDLVNFDGLSEELYSVDNEVLHDAGYYLSLLKLPICPNLWGDSNRDVSMMILNELIPMAFTSSMYYFEEHSIDGGRVDIVGKENGSGDIFHAMEIELGNSARSDSDILKLARIGEQYPDAELSIIAPSKKLLTRWEKSTKSAEVICKSLKRLHGIVKNVERINVIELCLPEENKNLHEVRLDKITTNQGLFKRTRGVSKMDRRRFISKNQVEFAITTKVPWKFQYE